MTGAAPGQDGKRADIQGLRAIAVLSVVAFHMHSGWLPGGFVGVDIFFVISGFLITGILLRELERERMSIAGFYYRRIRRIFPALFVMLAIVLGAGALIMAPPDFAELARTAVSTVFFVSNFDFYTLSGYFDGPAADKPLLHTWSLAVEEQFYILFPLLLAFVWRFMRTWLGPLLIVGTLAALALSAWGAFEHRTAAFYLTPFRAFELAIGALAALYGPRLRLTQITRDALSLAGAALMAASFVFFDGATPFPGLAALAPCAGAGLVILAGINGASAFGRAISLPAFTFFGAISYSLYLWHWPALALGRHYFFGEPPLWVNALLIAAAVAAAWLSWRFVEEPILRAPMKRVSVFAWGGGAIAVTAAVAGAIYLADGFPERFSPRARALFAAAEDYNRDRDHCHGPMDHEIAYDNNCLFGAREATPHIAVWSDSAGAELVVAMGEALAARGQSVIEISASACPPVLGYALTDETPTCIAHNDSTLAHLLADARITTVVLALNVARYPETDQLFAALDRSVRALRSGGKTVVLAYPAPNPWGDPPRELGLRAARGAPIETAGVSLRDYRADNAEAIVFYDGLVQRTGAIAFRPADAVCTDTFCPLYRPGLGVLYFNGNHLSVTGARLALERFPFEALALQQTSPT